MSTLKPSERITIRVVQVPTTGELLDDYYRQRGLERGSRSDPEVRGTGNRRTPSRDHGHGHRKQS